MKWDSTLEINPSIDENLIYYKDGKFSIENSMDYFIIGINTLDTYLKENKKCIVSLRKRQIKSRWIKVLNNKIKNV